MAPRGPRHGASEAREEGGRGRPGYASGRGRLRPGGRSAWTMTTQPEEGERKNGGEPLGEGGREGRGGGGGPGTPPAGAARVRLRPVWACRLDDDHVAGGRGKKKNCGDPLGEEGREGRGGGGREDRGEKPLSELGAEGLAHRGTWPCYPTGRARGSRHAARSSRHSARATAPTGWPTGGRGRVTVLVAGSRLAARVGSKLRCVRAPRAPIPRKLQGVVPPGPRSHVVYAAPALETPRFLVNHAASEPRKLGSLVMYTASALPGPR